MIKYLKEYIGRIKEKYSKPHEALADISGKSMLEHVVSRLSAASASNLHVAPDSEEIVE